ncbi:MAG: carbohydrate porin [Acidobacteriota bacterium]|nr:carbohydrate porin [Acidobacteriota bacterium]
MRWLLVAGFAVCAGPWCRAQEAAIANKDAPNAPAPRSIEDLNYLGGEAAMPLFEDSLIPVQSKFRQGLAVKGLAFRVLSGPQYVQNLLDAPVKADEQVYAGQHPFEMMFWQPILSWDMRQLGMHRAQIYTGAAVQWVSWRPAGPKTIQMWALYFYKELARDRVEIKTGYVAHNMNFVGLFVGGSTSTASQGVYAVLPFEAGMSYWPLTSPAFDLKIRGPRNTYWKGAAQRSVDPKGGPTEVDRNHTGFRFIPHGDKLVTINEVGYQRASGPDQRDVWFRAGYIGNRTAYTNARNGLEESGNHCAYALIDGQLVQTDTAHPGHGWYMGGSVMAVPESKNAYARYYEVRLYDKAPFRSRPDDVAALVASRTGYSSVFTDNYVAAGKTVWRAGTTVTGSYSIRTHPGSYISFGLGYLYGPAITPRVSNALNFTANWYWFF